MGNHISNAATAEWEGMMIHPELPLSNGLCHGWVKINLDGATAVRGNWSATGEVLPDSHGN